MKCMNLVVTLIIIVSLLVMTLSSARKISKKKTRKSGRTGSYYNETLHVGIGELCVSREYPDENGYWHKADPYVKKICPKGTSCISVRRTIKTYMEDFEPYGCCICVCIILIVQFVHFQQNACNCDDLEDGTILEVSWDEKTRRDECKAIFGQRCSSNDDCTYNYPCVKRKCACPRDESYGCRKEKRILELYP